MTAAEPDPAPVRVIGSYLSPDVRNAAFARYRVDPERWPRTASFVDRVLAQECLAKLQACESLMLRTPIPEQRAALRAAGAPITADTVGSDFPRQGVMRLP